MTVTHDQEEKNKSYWDKERLEKFWGRNPSQEFNDKHEDFNDIQSELNSLVPADVKESKKIRRFPSGAVRSDDRGRIKPSYISPYALEEIAEHFGNNENDFGATNYFKGIKPGDIIDSVGRHYLDLQKALIERDNDQLRKDFRSLAANCIMALHQIVIEERGQYREIYEKTEYIDIEYAKSNQQ